MPGEKGNQMSVILLVEDNDMNRDMLTKRLMRKGYQVIPASDGKQGLGLALSEKPDLILMDLACRSWTDGKPPKKLNPIRI